MAKVIIIAIISATLITAVVSAAVGGDPGESGCTCGVFPDNSPIPIIEQSVEFGVSCDDEGSQICQNLCIALAQGARDQAPALICEKLDKHVENLKVAVFTKTICDGNDEWKFTGLKTPEAICCEGGKEVACSSGISQDSSTISPDIV